MQADPSENSRSSPRPRLPGAEGPPQGSPRKPQMLPSRHSRALAVGAGAGLGGAGASRPWGPTAAMAGGVGGSEGEGRTAARTGLACCGLRVKGSSHLRGTVGREAKTKDGFYLRLEKRRSGGEERAEEGRGGSVAGEMSLRW